MSFDYLPDTNIYLKQRKDMFRVNTDTHLLGNFMLVKKNESVLDIGTNNGALLLYASRYTDDLSGVDILKEAIELAAFNMEYNGLNAKLYHMPIQDFNVVIYDVIVCNPPYFHTAKNGNKNENHFLMAARHDHYLPLDELFKAYKRLLKDNGRIYMVHRASYCMIINHYCNQYGFKITRMKIVYDENKDEAVSVLLEIRRGDIDIVKLERDEIIR